jgi:hypothetical protein
VPGRIDKIQREGRAALACHESVYILIESSAVWKDRKCGEGREG